MSLNLLEEETAMYQCAGADVIGTDDVIDDDGAMSFCIQQQPQLRDWCDILDEEDELQPTVAPLAAAADEQAPIPIMNSRESQLRKDSGVISGSLTSSCSLSSSNDSTSSSDSSLKHHPLLSASATKLPDGWFGLSPPSESK